MIRVEDVLAFIARPTEVDADEEVIRCARALAAVDDRRTDLVALHRLWKVAAARCAGELVVQCLLAYEEHADEPEMALGAVYGWAHFRAPRLYSVDGLDGRVREARQAASELYGDCFLVMSEFIASWNHRMRLS